MRKFIAIHVYFKFLHSHQSHITDVGPTHATSDTKLLTSDNLRNNTTSWETKKEICESSEASATISKGIVSTMVEVNVALADMTFDKTETIQDISTAREVKEKICEANEQE